MLFTSHYEHSIDAKHRLAIPAEIRAQWRPEVHGSAWFATPWVIGGGVIRLYTEADFRSRAAASPLGLTPDEDEARLRTTLFGLSARLEMDAAGRIRIPDGMLTLVGLRSEVVLVGAGEWLEVMDRASWRESMSERLAQLPELMARIEAKRRAERSQKNGRE